MNLRTFVDHIAAYGTSEGVKKSWESRNRKGLDEQEEMHKTLSKHGWKQVTSHEETSKHPLADSKLREKEAAYAREPGPFSTKEDHQAFWSSVRHYVHPDKPDEYVETQPADSAQKYHNWTHLKSIPESEPTGMPAEWKRKPGGWRGRSGGGAAKLDTELSQT